MDVDIRVKCCVVGDFGVGKTSLVYAWLNRSTEGVQTTLGVDFFSKMLHIGTRSVRVSLWDTAGAERFRSLMYSYLRDANVIFVVYDRTDKNAMRSVTKWMRIVEQHAPDVVAVVGNKSDLTCPFSHPLRETLEPYERMQWNIVTGNVSSRRPSTFSNMVRRTLVTLWPENKDAPDIKIRTIRFNPQPPRMQKCCT